MLSFPFETATFRNRTCVLIRGQILISVTKCFARWKYRNAQYRNINSLHTRQKTYYLVSRNLIVRNFISHNNFLLPFDCFRTINETQITVRFLCLRLQQRSIERAMDLTDSFTWEDLPTTDAHTGQLTAAGWIPRINKFSMRAATAMLCFHTVQSTIRIVTNHETIFIGWYPIDWTVTPFYELVNISRVTLGKTEYTLSILVVFLI